MSTLNTADDRSPWFIQTTAPFMALSSVAMILRFWSRLVGPRGHKFWWDDWTALVAWAESFALGIIGIAWTWHGLGKHTTSLTPSEGVAGFKLLWASYFLFTSGIAVLKTSALLFYARVFNNVRWFRKALWISHTLVAIWLVTFLCTIIFNCTPVIKFVYREKPGTCIDLYAWYLACGAFDVVLDVLVLVLPMPMLWKLQCGRTRKISIFFAFICGYLALIPSIGRLWSTVAGGKDMTTDFTYAAIPDLLWSYVEGPVGVISICIPSWFHLFKRAKNLGVSSLFTAHDPHTRITKEGSSADYRIAQHHSQHRSQSGSRRDSCMTECQTSHAHDLSDDKYLGGQSSTAKSSDKSLITKDLRYTGVQTDIAINGERLTE